MKFIYVVSDEVNYDKLISNDAGPLYAKAMLWDFEQISGLAKFNPKNVYIIDNRITANETKKIAILILENQTIKFILKIVDPFIEHSEHYYYQWILEMARYSNVYLLSVYQMIEFTKAIVKEIKKKLIHIPYPYDETRELKLERLQERKNKIIISGSVNINVYPIRANIWKKSRRSLSRIFFDVLKHPGYSEVNNKDFIHKYIGQEYVKYLSKYKFMLVCGSRCQIELLKFHECAYAGCIPVGEAPLSFPVTIRSLFIHINVKNLTSNSLRVIAKWREKDHLEIVLQLRIFLRENRNAVILNKTLLTFISTV